jgi:hypothetical protein
MYILCICPDSNRQLGPADRIGGTDEVQLGAADHGDMGSDIACESNNEAYEDGDSYIVNITSSNSLFPEYGDELGDNVFNVEPSRTRHSHSISCIGM